MEQIRRFSRHRRHKRPYAGSNTTILKTRCKMKNIAITVACALLLLFSGCAKKEASFDGVVMEIHENSVLVAPCEGEDILRSADRISFSAADLSDIEAEVGDTVSVTYSGDVMESYPAQVTAVKWSIKEKGSIEQEMSIMPYSEELKLAENTKTAEYSYEDVYMSLTLPEGWEYEIIPAALDSDPASYGIIYGINFWRTDSPELSLTLEYHPRGIGICGTGVTFEDMVFESGLTATKCTESLDGDIYWFFLIYDEPHNNYAVSCSADSALWNEHESEIMAILETVTLG